MEKNLKLGNPNIFALGAFGYSLAMLGTELLIDHAAAGATMYAVLFAGLMELIAGMWLIAKGESYLASIVAFFGGWLIGLFLLSTQGDVLGIANDVGKAWYMFALLPPIALLSIPAFKMRRVKLIGAFIALFVLVLFLGLGFNLGPAGAGHSSMVIAGWFAWIAMIFIWWLMYDNIMELFHPHEE
jgi:succinate-acetate transporter protein